MHLHKQFSSNPSPSVIRSLFLIQVLEIRWIIKDKTEPHSGIIALFTGEKLWSSMSQWRVQENENIGVNFSWNERVCG